MPIPTFSLKPVDTKPIWQQMEPLPVSFTSTGSITTSEDWDDRYVYYINWSYFYAYDKVANNFQKLAPPLVGTSVFASLRYSKYSWNKGRIISSVSSTVLRIAWLEAWIFTWKKIKITNWKWAWQERTIIDSPEPIIYTAWVVTANATNYITDTTKKWKVNQWAWYQIRFTYAAGQTQIRKILYNTTNTVYWSDSNYQPIDPFNNSTVYTALSATAWRQTHFVIEATDIVLDTPFDILPDNSSRFSIETWWIWLLSSTWRAPFYTLQFYDIAWDYWQQKTASAWLILSAFWTDWSIERTWEIWWVYKSWTVTSASNFTLADTLLTWVEINRYINYRIRITWWTWIWQSRRITSNWTTYFNVIKKWEVLPDTTSTYEIIADKNKLYFTWNGQSVLLWYDIVSDLPIIWSKIDNWLANTMALTMEWIDQPIVIAVSSAVKQSSDTSVVTVNPVPTAKWTNYLVWDILTLSTGSQAKVIVESISPWWLVETVSLYYSWTTWYSVNTFNTTWWTWTWCTIAVTSIWRVWAISTPVYHPFKIWDIVKFSWATSSDWNKTYTIIWTDSTTVLSVVITATASAVALNSQSATVIVDSTKNWDVNELVWKIIQTHTYWTNWTMQPRIILSNTSTTITVATITTSLVNWNWRYIITEWSAFGRDDQFKILNQQWLWTATWWTTTTLIDSTKNFIVNWFAWARMQITDWTWRWTNIIITSNTETTLNYPDAWFTPDNTTVYKIQDTWWNCTRLWSTTTLVDSTKKWDVNQWAWKRLRFTWWTWFWLAAGLNEITIVSNTSNTLTFWAVSWLAPNVDTTYTILWNPISWLWIELIWVFGWISWWRYLFKPRWSSSNTVDRYDITTEKYKYWIFNSPHVDIMSTWSSYAYDWNNRVYFSVVPVSGYIQYIQYYDFIYNKIYWFASIPNTQSTPVLWNKMEIVKSPSWVSYLYVWRNNATECYRVPIYY